MGLRGTKAKERVKIAWSSEFAYAIGLITTDGYLSQNGRHVALTSKDVEQIENFQRCLGLQEIKIGKNISGGRKVSWRVQFGDVVFHSFLREIGLTPAKSKTMGKVTVPEQYFRDFLRGHFDGDGSSYSYWDPRWRSSFMLYAVFISASEKHIVWLREEIRKHLGVWGHLSPRTEKTACFQLKFAKTEALKIFRFLYKKTDDVCLSRKRLKVEKALGIVGEHL